MIALTLKQLVFVGMHLGHMYSNNVFFSSWMIFGKRNRLAIFNLILSLFSFKVASSIVKKSIMLHRSVLFVNYNIKFSYIISRYAYICGELFSSYKWINGFLTNFRKIINYNNFIYNLIIKDKYIFRNRDKENFSKFYGLIFNRKSLPFSVIVTSVSKAYNVIMEAFNLVIPSIGIVDSNVFSYNISVPIPGNDISFKCVNFYNYFFSKLIMVYKINNFVKFIKIKRKYKRNKIRRNFMAFGLFLNNMLTKSNFFKIVKKTKLKRFDNVFFDNFLNKDVIVTWDNNKVFPSKIEKKK